MFYIDYLIYNLSIKVIFISIVGFINQYSYCSIEADSSNEPAIEVYIVQPDGRLNPDIGSSFTLQCRFKKQNNASEIRFNLRWLRSIITSNSDYHNETITETDISPTSATIIAATTRIWSVRKDDGLDLEVNSFQSIDVGTYYCQAVSLDRSPEMILHETSIQLTGLDLLDQKQQQQHPPPEVREPFDSNELYSQENLSKLLPSLKIIPSSFNELSQGDRIQLTCITNDLDPDPEPDQIEWSFEQSSLNRLELKHDKGPSYVAAPIPTTNVTILANVLIIWSVSGEHSGIYKCTYQMKDFNLTSQASAEIALRDANQYDSAPLVYVKPELVRLSINGSAMIQCEVTGYPAPQIIWYRVDDSAKSESLISVNGSNQNLELGGSSLIINESNLIDNLILESVPYQDMSAYCRLNKCSHPIDQSPASRLTGLSRIYLDEARALHQGQYVCQAMNKHGSNQASCIVDVELKEMPAVNIPEQFREQIIELTTSNDQSNSKNVSFKCQIEAGRPKPRLRWLRLGKNSILLNDNKQDFDSYDLRKVSSASSNVLLTQEDNGNSLILTLGTVSLDDEGDYICLGDNELGRQSSVAKLIVRKAASIRILQTSPYVARINDSFHLDCLVSGYPIPIDVEWSRTDKGSFFSLISRNSIPSRSQERAILKFDRVSQEDSGEYTCNARDPLDKNTILRDTIMLVIGLAGRGDQKEASDMTRWNELNNNLLPKLMVRPTKLNTLLGSNVTLDCLAVSGLQPTLVEWMAPARVLQLGQEESSSGMTDEITANSIRHYYRAGASDTHQLMQFGSKLRILNVSKAHEGIYQCKGKNKVGSENAPALIKVLDPKQQDDSTWRQLARAYEHQAGSGGGAGTSEIKTKVAKYGTNIELKCQVNGVEQPATSWSRDGLELPGSSVQIGHNLWLKNVTSKDNGLYVCSARSKEPNRVIQARINLLVEGSFEEESRRILSKSLRAKIIPSKNQVNEGDSITLECIININLNGTNETTSSRIGDLRSKLGEELDLIEQNVVWTNLHSGQSLFQDNVYIQGNLLIIYELKIENSAIYRCNYNELTQFTDYKLQVQSSLKSAPSESQTISQEAKSLRGREILAGNGQRAELKQVPVGSRLQLDCRSNHQHYYWTRGGYKTNLLVADNRALVIESVRSRDADVYSCITRDGATLLEQLVVNVLIPIARFAQSPVSFVTLPTISGSNQQQLEIEVKFLAEDDQGLLLFSGQQQQQQQEYSLNSTSGPSNSDYISLGLVDGFVELKFELGDGTTTLRSPKAISLLEWHRVMIERNKRGAVMWLDDQPAVSNTSTGKFFNLNLADSVLFVGGHEHFLYNHGVGGTKNSFYGYSNGFKGCMSLLRISRQEVNLTTRNRTVTVGIFECDKQECARSLCSPQTMVANDTTKGVDFEQQEVAANGVCQIDRGDFEHKWEPIQGQSAIDSGMRCICMIGFDGHKCQDQVPLASNNRTVSNLTSGTSTATTISNTVPRACDLLNPCNAQGTISCQSLTSSSFKCHCKIGFMGSDCSKPTIYENESSVLFEQQGYVQLRFNKPEEVEQQLRQKSLNGTLNLADRGFNSSNHQAQISMLDNQNISFNLQTKSSFGLLFFTGQLSFDNGNGNGSLGGSSSNSSNQPRGRQSSSHHQASKSMIANLIVRLSRGSVSDFLAIALVDGHVEVSYELGSGVTILRSYQRVNDGDSHSINVIRSGKLTRLIIDHANKYETTSPGKLSMLNTDNEHFFVGGLPMIESPPTTTTTVSQQVSTNVIYSTYLANFVGCISQFEINSLGPLNLIRSDHLTELRFAQNLAPCSGRQQQQQQNSQAKNKLGGQQPKPYSSPSTESDDPDELR